MTEEQRYPQWRVEDVDGHTCALKISSPVPDEGHPDYDDGWDPTYIVATLGAQVDCPPWTNIGANLHLLDWDFDSDDQRMYVILVFDDSDANPNPCEVCAREDAEELAERERQELERGKQAALF